MNLYLLSILFLLDATGSKTPNFYPSYIAAREASKNYEKDLLIFFSKSSCAECDVAWNSFEKDQLATKIFISTLVDAYDFDGAVILDKYGLNSAPSWVILDSKGALKEKWAGDWKNPHVRPANPVAAEEPKPESKPIPVFKATPAAPPTPIKVAETPKVSPPVKAIVAEKPVAETVTPMEKSIALTPVATTKTEMPATGFVLQAGYFGSEANAQKLVTDLSGKGFEMYKIKTTVQNGTTFYRVISPAFDSENEANKVLQALSGSGIKATIKKMSEI